jgi:catechol 2,3-dioxygenase-like lactoylglutathione lyase family enzyme
MPWLRPLLTSLAVAVLGAAPGAAEPLTGDEIARKIEARPRPARVSRIATLTMIREEGKTRERQLASFWKTQPDARWIAFFTLSPPNLKNESFVSLDYVDWSRDDDQWIYVPERKRAQRVASPQRGDPFLGSDFSLEDMKNEDRVEIGEYTWRALGKGLFEGRELLVLEQTPVTPELARNLGYGRIVSHVDPSNWVRLRMEFYDPEGVRLKSFAMREIQEEDGAWTVKRIEAVDHETGHRSVLAFSDIDTTSPVADEIFTPRTMERERAASLLPRKSD